MNEHHGSTLESLFDELGEREEVEALAAKKILAIQFGKRMKELRLTKSALAGQMKTSRAQLLRVLDQDDAGITLKVLVRAAHVLKLQLRVSLEPSTKFTSLKPERKKALSGDILKKKGPTLGGTNKQSKTSSPHKGEPVSTRPS